MMASVYLTNLSFATYNSVTVFRRVFPSWVLYLFTEVFGQCPALFREVHGDQGDSWQLA